MRHPLRHHRFPVVRAAGLLVAAWTALALAGRLFWFTVGDTWAAVSTSGPDAPADLLVLGAAAAGVVLTAWLALGLLLAVVATVPGAAGRAVAGGADLLAPPFVRRGVALALGTALVAGLPAAAHADPPRPPSAAASLVPAPAADPSFAVTVVTAVPGDAGAPGVPDPGFAVTGDEPPPRPAVTLGPLGPAPHATPSRPPGSVRVERGDSLWRIAARHLGPAATTPQIAREWPRWYAANRAVIGPDPDRIRTGQLLTPPASSSGGARP
jgi:nucleoid-associated protein YgaU